MCSVLVHSHDLLFWMRHHSNAGTLNTWLSIALHIPVVIFLIACADTVPAVRLTADGEIILGLATVISKKMF